MKTAPGVTQGEIPDSGFTFREPGGLFSSASLMLATESGVLVLLLVGAEQVRVVPGLMRASPLDFVSYPSSHGYG